MWTRFLTIALLTFVAATAVAEQGTVYKWVDSDGVVHYGDSIPAEYAELPKQVLNDHGVTVEHLEGKKTPEQIEAERVASELNARRQLQRRADQTLLATYLSVDEINMHRDRRIELFQAQARVTELYLRNLDSRLNALLTEASGFRPYSRDVDAPFIDPGLAKDVRETKTTIERHQQNLRKYQADEQQIVARFEGDVSRFKKLKGLDD